MKKIAVLIETRNEKIKSAMYGVISAAQGADRELIALVFTADVTPHVDPLARFGINKIIVVTGMENTNITNPNRRAEAIIAALTYFKVDTLFALTSIEGKEILPRIAARLDAPLVLDCLQVNLADSTVEKSLFSGKVIATVRVSGTPRIFGFRPNVFEAKSMPVAAEIIPFEYDGPFDDRYQTKERDTYQTKEMNRGMSDTVDLSEADIIISGGRGMQNKENFEILHECAKVMGAAVGASRVAVDAGWVPHAMQVGQTGATVCPKLYIACGISGSVQHFAGMKTAGTIVCINSDPGAAMMQHCDYGIVGDLFEIVPTLTCQLKEAQ